MAARVIGSCPGPNRRSWPAFGMAAALTVSAGLWMPAPALAQQTVQPASVPPAVTQLSGGWELSSADGKRKCRLTLRPQETQGGRLVGFPGPCRRALPVLGRVQAWTVSADGLIRLVDATGTAVLAFEEDPAPFKLRASADGQEFLLDSLGRQRRAVTRPAAPPPPRVAFDPARAPARDTIPGLYGMMRYGGQEVCRIQLGTQPGASDDRFLTSFPVRCRDQGLRTFDAVAWRYAGGRLFLIARRGHEIALVPTGEGSWTKDPPGGSELQLKRVAQP
jgi:hypothetical protein